MDRTPFKELTGDNVVNLCDSQEFDKFNGSPMPRPRISIIKAFDPLYKSPSECVLSQNVLNRTVDKNEASQVTNISNSNIIEIDVDDSFNNENYNPASTKKSEERFISDVQEFTEGIIMEAKSRIFLNKEFNETVDAAIQDITRRVADDSTIHNESNICVSDQVTENSSLQEENETIRMQKDQSHACNLETSAEKDEYIAQLEKTLAEKEKDFSAAMSSLKQHIESQLNDIKTLQHKNILAERHLSSLEIVFADVHKRSKAIIQGYKELMSKAKHLEIKNSSLASALEPKN